MLQRRGQSSRGHFDDRAASCAHRVMVRVGSQAVGGDAALQGQRMQHTLVDQGGHRAVDRRQVRRLVFGRQALAQPLVDLGNRQMTVDRLQHCQDRDPGGHPAQPMSAQQLADPLDDDRIQSRGPGHSSSITQPIVESHPMAGSDAVRLTSCPICRARFDLRCAARRGCVAFSRRGGGRAGGDRVGRRRAPRCGRARRRDGLAPAAGTGRRRTAAGVGAGR